MLFMHDIHNAAETNEATSKPSRLARRSAIALGLASVAVAGVVYAKPESIAAADVASNASAKSVVPTNEITAKAVTFNNNGLQMAGNLYLPKGFNANHKYAAIITVHPGGGVKEQTAGGYAQRLADQGFVTLAFDASHQGASEGMPRYLDDPALRVGDIYSAIDYVTSLPYVDTANIGALGICAGSGATVKAASFDHRVKAIATVSAVDVGAATRRGWDGNNRESDLIPTLDAVAKQRTAEANGAAPVYVPYVPAVGDKTAPFDLQQAADYYLTPRGQHPNAPNKMLLTSVSRLAAFDGFGQAGTLLTQPLLVVAGTAAGSLWQSKELYAKATGPKELSLVDGATHMDLYDGPGMNVAMTKVAPFFKRKLDAKTK